VARLTPFDVVEDDVRGLEDDAPLPIFDGGGI
jgi:hypothetical protein